MKGLKAQVEALEIAEKVSLEKRPRLLSNLQLFTFICSGTPLFCQKSCRNDTSHAKKSNKNKGKVEFWTKN